MKEGSKKGGSTITGLNFQREKDILDLLKKVKNYTIKGFDIYYQGKIVARSLRQHALYDYLSKNGVDWENIISKKLLPDDALYVIVNNTLFVIEVKFQKVAGSVDEKLQTCDFKRKQYAKLMAPLNIEVEYIYILSD
jgi:hypothetical protein